MKVIIAGSRTIKDRILVYNAINEAISKLGFDITEIEVVSGCAKGVDEFGEKWAYLRGIPAKKFPADWDLYGKAAGFIRNKKMAEYADALILIWDGKSRGSANMKALAEERKLLIYEKIIVNK